MIPITINGRKTEVKEGTTVLAAARSLEIPIPTLCDHPALEPSGACRLCLTEIKARGKTRMVTACNYPVREEMEVFTETPKVVEHRRNLLSLLLARWPNVKVLKGYAARYGATEAGYKHPGRDEREDACILCGMCVRGCSEITWENIIGFTGRGAGRRVAMPFETQYDRCIGCATCAAICPTGAIKVADEALQPVDPKRITKFGLTFGTEIAALDDQQCQMRRVGTAHLVEIMDAYHLLPTHNYKFGQHKDTPRIASRVWKELFTQNMPDGCWAGCLMACAKAIEGFVPQTGPYKGHKVIVDGPEYETVAGCGSNMGIFDPHVIVEINFYCDTYGVDTISFGTSMAFVMECYEARILDRQKTGGLDLRFGRGLDALEVLHQMARGQGFGVIVGKGIRQMKRIFAEEFGGDPKFLHDIGMEVKGLEYSEYVSKESLAQQGGYAMAMKGPQHDEAWLIFMDMVNNHIPSFEDKAEALHYFPMFRTWFGLMGLCKLPWNDVEPADNAQTSEPAKVPGHVEAYCNMYAATTGNEITPKDLIRMSERVYNFQRVFNLRMGFGTREHDRGPYRAMGPVTAEEWEARGEYYDKQLKEKAGVDPEDLTTLEKVAALRKHREAQYESLLDAVYKRRSWTRNGVPKIEHLKSLGLDMPWLLEVVAPHQE
ncbi:MAG: aldehyde ferredoxin oxidoreductase C-terminal domain-containing protein [Deltaproteobacteria bacterium]|nr:aldehyde ferredoxin oxidoreductase C-terminal domain-containing protein [Deltaproteobacteria bacterium]